MSLLNPRQFEPHQGSPPFFTGETGDRGGPLWKAPTHEYAGRMEVAPEVHALTEGGGRYTSSIYPSVEMNPVKGHYITVQQTHPKHQTDVFRRYGKRVPTFSVEYYHEGDAPAFEGTIRHDMSDIIPGNRSAITHHKGLYSGEDPREAQKTAVTAMMNIHRGRRD